MWCTCTFLNHLKEKNQQLLCALFLENWLCCYSLLYRTSLLWQWHHFCLVCLHHLWTWYVARCAHFINPQEEKVCFSSWGHRCTHSAAQLSKRFKALLHQGCCWIGKNTNKKFSYVVVFNLTPARNTHYSLRTSDNIPCFNIKHNFFRNSFFPSTIIEWNKLDISLRTIASTSSKRNF